MTVAAVLVVSVLGLMTSPCLRPSTAGRTIGHGRKGRWSPRGPQQVAWSRRARLRAPARISSGPVPAPGRLVSGLRRPQAHINLLCMPDLMVAKLAAVARNGGSRAPRLGLAATVRGASLAVATRRTGGAHAQVARRGNGDQQAGHRPGRRRIRRRDTVVRFDLPRRVRQPSRAGARHRGSPGPLGNQARRGRRGRSRNPLGAGRVPARPVAEYQGGSGPPVRSPSPPNPPHRAGRLTA